MRSNFSKEEKEKYHSSNKDYYEATIQLRNFNEKQFEAVVHYIEDSGGRIAKFIELKNGVDLLVSSQKLAQQVAKAISASEKCQIKFSRKIHTRDINSMKDVYRLTVLIEFFSFAIGDIVEYQGEKVKITSIGREPVGRVLSTGKRVFIDTKLLR